METLTGKLDRLLRRQFKGAGTQLETFERPRRIGGFLIWNGFTGMDADNRVKLLYDFLREQLDHSEFSKVDLIMPVTRPEMQFRNEQLDQEKTEIGGSQPKVKSS